MATLHMMKMMKMMVMVLRRMGIEDGRHSENKMHMKMKMTEDDDEDTPE